MSENDKASLSDEEIKRIVYEEKLRIRIRSELEPNEKGKKLKIWKFLNSPFGLLLLSTIFISGVGKLYTDFQQKMRDNLRNNQEMFKLATEYSYRLEKIKHHFYALENGNLAKVEAQSHSIFIWRIVTGDKAYSPSLPGFLNLKMFGIINQLRLFGVSEYSNQAKTALIDIEYAKSDEWIFDLKRLKNNISILELYHNTLQQEIDFLRL